MSRTDRYEYQDWNGFGARTKNYRTAIGLTKETFADMINRSENYISELEKGNSSCSVHTLYQISKALRVPSDSLLYEESEMYKAKEKNIKFLVISASDFKAEYINIIDGFIKKPIKDLEVIVKELYRLKKDF